MSESEAFEILELSSSPSDSEIKKAYRKKCREFHPDALAGRKLPEDFHEYAKEQMHKVQDAYEMLKKNRGL